MEKITNDIFYAGVNDHEIDLFEGQYIVPLGMAYNSYVIIDEKIAVIDSVGGSFADEWLGKIEEICAGRTPDYLVVQHMEPDHSANLHLFMEKYPNAQIAASAKAWPLMKAFNGSDYEGRSITAADGGELELGAHTLRFIAAPMVHWPEVIMTYDSADKVFFSADAFGKFGALDADEDWACEARRYYFGIVGKYGAQVQTLLKKAAALEINTICPLHGPVLSENLGYYLDLYNTWSSYGVESEGIVINYTSVYGNTKKAVEKLAALLEAKGCPKVAVNDLARCDMAEAVEDTFRYGTIVLATTTYNGDIFPFMRQFIDNLTERGIKNKKIALIENGSWGPMAIKKMTAMLEGMKNIEYAENSVTIKSALDAEGEAKLEALAEELLK
jgi:flavorubredoxin